MLLANEGTSRTDKMARRLLELTAIAEALPQPPGRDVVLRDAEQVFRTPVVTRPGAAGMTNFLPNLAVFAPVDQHYLLQARQMQALSFAVHIPLVCFGIALPVMVLFAEWLYLRSGDQVYRTLARRWSRVMLTLFAVGVITGTRVEFRDGAAVAELHRDVRERIRPGVRDRGLLVLHRGDLHRYLRVRVGPACLVGLHLLSGIPIVITGFTGSLMVISVNAWMNHPGGFRLHGGRVLDVDPFRALFENTYLWHELIHMYVAGYIVTGFVLAGVYAFGRLRGRWGRYERTALAIPLTDRGAGVDRAGTGR